MSDVAKAIAVMREGGVHAFVPRQGVQTEVDITDEITALIARSQCSIDSNLGDIQAMDHLLTKLMPQDTCMTDFNPAIGDVIAGPYRVEEDGTAVPIHHWIPTHHWLPKKKTAPWTSTELRAAFEALVEAAENEPHGCGNTDDPNTIGCGECPPCQTRDALAAVEKARQ